VAGAAATGRAHLVAPTVACSAPGREHPAAARAHRAPAGGQAGHAGPTRGLLPREEVDVVVPVTPERGRRCQPPWQGEDPQPQRPQVRE
jgi:hypothetical protein